MVGSLCAYTRKSYLPIRTRVLIPPNNKKQINKPTVTAHTQAQTPVSAAMEALNWVNFTLEGLSPGPSTKLLEYYRVRFVDSLLC